MISSRVLCWSLGSIALAAPAAAQEVGAQERDWSLSAGLLLGAAPLGGLGVVGIPVAAPAGIVALERRISDRGWWVVRGDVQVSREDAGQGASSTSLALEGLTGIRWALTGLDPIELSFFALAGPSLARSTSGPSADVTNFGMSGQVGLAVERRLIDALSLRLAAPLLEGAWSHSEGTVQNSDGSTSKIRADAWTARAILAPSLELKFLF
jgi:hypothetical protein